MRVLLLLQILLFGTAYAQSPANSPLTPDEGRAVLGQLYELRSTREEIKTLESYVDRDKEQDSREKANADRALELERKATAIAEQERDLQKDKAALYEQLYRSVTKGPGVGCRILRAITVGIARCN
jgi:hypothetical protein